MVLPGRLYMGDFLFCAGFMDRMVVLVLPIDVDNPYVLVVEIRTDHTNS
jgi:hypothetical protein